MKKKFINALVLGGVAVLGLAGLVGCGETKEEPTPVTGMSITNKDDLSAVWTIGEADRTMAFTFEGAKVNVASAISKGLLTITSSDSAVVVANGFVLQAAGTAGTAVITATYTNDESLGGASFSDTVEVSVKESDKELAAKAVTIKEFKEATIATDDSGNLINKEVYQITGKIKGFGKAEASLTETSDGAGTYGNLFLTDDTDTVQIYGCSVTNTCLNFVDGKWKFTNPKDFTSNAWTAGLKAGDEITMFVTRCDYKGVIEGNGRIVAGPTLVSGTEVDFADIVNDSNVTAGAKVFVSTATIKGFGSKEASLTENVTDAGVYGNMFVTDGTNTIQVYGATAGEGAISWTGSKYKFTNPKDFQSNEVTSALKAGDKIKFVAIRADYNGVKEISIQSITKVA